MDEQGLRGLSKNVHALLYRVQSASFCYIVCTFGGSKLVTKNALQN